MSERTACPTSRLSRACWRRSRDRAEAGSGSGFRTAGEGAELECVGVDGAGGVWVRQHVASEQPARVARGVVGDENPDRLTVCPVYCMSIGDGRLSFPVPTADQPRHPNSRPPGVEYDTMMVCEWPATLRVESARPVPFPECPSRPDAHSGCSLGRAPSTRRSAATDTPSRRWWVQPRRRP